MEMIQPTKNFASGINQEKNNNMATKSMTRMSRGRKTEPPVNGPFKMPSLVDAVSATTSKFKSDPNYNYNDAKKRNPGGKVVDEMRIKRESFQKDYAKGNMSRSQLVDSVQTTLEPSFGTRKHAEAKTKSMIGGRSTNKAYKGGKQECQKGAGKAGGGVNMCKPPKGSNGKATIF